MMAERPSGMRKLSLIILTRSTAALCFVVWLLSSSTPASAYEQDVHFYLTYTLSRLAGLTDSEAFIVARADQSLDDNHETTAFEWPPPLKYIQHGKDWHALNTDQRLVMDRFLSLQCAAGVRWSINRTIEHTCGAGTTKGSMQLVKLGQFLHYYQDTYSHSDKNELQSDWSTYGPLWGHFFEGHAPDRVPYNVGLAKRMAADVFATLQRFVGDRGEGRIVSIPDYRKERIIGELVDALDDSYTNYMKNYRPGPNFIPPSVPSGGPRPPQLLPVYYDAADVLKVRCNLSRSIQIEGLSIGKPDVKFIVYSRPKDVLRYDSFGHFESIPGNDGRYSSISHIDRTIQCNPVIPAGLFVLNDKSDVASADKYVTGYTQSTSQPVKFAVGQGPLAYTGSVLASARGNVFVAIAFNVFQVPSNLPVSLPSDTNGPKPIYTNGSIFGLATDAAGVLFVGCQLGIAVIPPPYMATETTIMPPHVGSFGAFDDFAVDAAGDVFVVKGVNKTDVEIFTPPYNASPSIVSDSGNIAVGSSGVLFVLGANINVYEPPYTGPPVATIHHSGYRKRAIVDGVGDLFVADSLNNNVSEYKPPYSGAPTIIDTGSADVRSYNPLSIAVDQNQNLIVANYGSAGITGDWGNVLIYAPPYTGKPTVLGAAQGILSPVSVVVVK